MTPPPPQSFTRYLVIFAATVIGLIGLVWAYVAARPAAFMESGYASWAAKAAMLDECRLGRVAFFGDSRLEAGVMPAGLPVSASNFGLAAGTAVEARVAIDRALRCPDPPTQVVISLVPEHFGPLSRFFWLLSLRYGFLGLGDVRAVEALAASLGDHESLATATPEGLSGPARDWLYALHFPSLSFGSLVQGRVFGRAASNAARMATVEADRGWSAYEGGERVRAERADRFTATKLQDAELVAALEALRGRGIAAALLIMPFAVGHDETDAALSAYRDHLAALAARTGAVLLDPAIPVWPDRFFADGAHLDPTGARLFTSALAGCLHDGRFAPPCSLDPPAEAAQR